MRYLGFCMALFCFGLPALAGAARAQTPSGTKADRAADRQAIVALNRSLADAVGRGDAKAVASLFEPDARLTTEDGLTISGLEEVQEYFASAFALSPDLKLTIDSTGTRFPAPDLAVDEGNTVVERKDGERHFARYVAEIVRRDGQWRFANVRDEAARDVKPAERLKELAWLVGDWVTEGDDAVVTSSCAWDADRAFLLRKFVVNVQGKPVLRGEQRIGWDPRSEQFHSWSFDSDGGFHEGSWSREGDAWLVRDRGVRADGRTVEAKHVLRLAGPQMIRWTTVDRSIGHKATSDLDEYVLVRKAPSPKKD
jgi:uncharacterized protein (TIGR02246 family)